MTTISINEAYRILEITTSADSNEIKSAYKRLALKSHPEKNPNDPLAHQTFVKISEAFKQLSNKLINIKEDEQGEQEEGEEDDDQEEDDEINDVLVDEDFEEEGEEEMAIPHMSNHRNNHRNVSSLNNQRGNLPNRRRNIHSDDFPHEDDFAYHMFEKMFFGKNNKFKSGKVTGGFMFSSRHECDCPHCRCYSKPKPPYIPKSQRPKDPSTLNSTSSSSTTTATTTTGNGIGTTGAGTTSLSKDQAIIERDKVDDWLVDFDEERNKQLKKLKKLTAKKTTKTKRKTNQGKNFLSFFLWLPSYHTYLQFELFHCALHYFRDGINSSYYCNC